MKAVSSAVLLAMIAMVPACEGAKLNGGSNGGSNETVLASGQNSPDAIAVDDANVYWLNRHTLGGIYRVPKTGGTAVAMTEGDFSAYGRYLAHDSGNVYVPQADAIQAFPKGGGPPITVVSGVRAGEVVVGGGFLYWFNTTPSSRNALASPVLLKVAVAGGTPVGVNLPLGDGDLFRLQTAFPNGVVSARCWAMNADAAYAFLDSSPIVRIPFTGGDASVTTGFTGIGDTLGNVAADETHLFVNATQTIDVVPLAGGAAVHLTPSNGGPIAIDDAFVYFMTTGAGPYGLAKMPKTGGDVTVLVNFEPNSAGAGAIAVDATSVYWTGVGGTILKAPK